MHAHEFCPSTSCANCGADEADLILCPTCGGENFCEECNVCTWAACDSFTPTDAYNLTILIGLRQGDQKDPEVQAEITRLERKKAAWRAKV